MYLLYSPVGIYNGAKGTVVGFAFMDSNEWDYSHNIVHTERGQMEIPVVLVKMDDDIGFSIIPTIPNIIPFTEQCDDTIKYGNHYHRWQLPLQNAFATTTHKMQGSTVKGNCVTMPSEKAPWARGLDYVANSRAKYLQKLFLMRPLRVQHFTSHPQERHSIGNEYKRLAHNLDKTLAHDL